MKLTDLSHEEKLALVGFLKIIIQADKEFSDEEAAELNKVAKEMGVPEFKETVNEAKKLFVKVGDIKEFSKKIERQPARELIFNILYEVALPGDIVPEEAKVLSWLAKRWEIPTYKNTDKLDKDDNSLE